MFGEVFVPVFSLVGELLLLTAKPVSAGVGLLACLFLFTQRTVPVKLGVICLLLTPFMCKRAFLDENKIREKMPALQNGPVFRVSFANSS